MDPPGQYFRAACIPADGLPPTCPHNLAIRFEFNTLDRYFLLSPDEAVIHGSEEEYRQVYQRTVFVSKDLVLSDFPEASKLASDVVIQISRLARVSLDRNLCIHLIRQLVNASETAARYDGKGVEVIVDTIEDHWVIVQSVGDGMVPAEETAVKALLEKEAARMEGDGESCVICMEELPRWTHAVRMPCSHVFHAHCIGRWLENSHYCPVCRYEMPPVT